ncbi:MAG: FAD-dependent oxidoreductase [Chloroflexi bacterium]|nr:FAD-dependent oxidoreductase [Chloroflexota bacterium]
MPSLVHLFRPIRIGPVELRNRIVMAPMVTNYATEDGQVTPRLIEYHTARARGGVGLVIVEAAYVRADGRSFTHQLGIHRDELVPGLRQLVDAVHAAGARIAIQLFHAGRQTTAATAGTQPIAPSSIPDPTLAEIPRELSAAEIQEVEGAFAAAARRAKAAGFDLIEIHGAHGYLIAEFLSPFANRRLDGYNAGILGRTRFAREIVEQVRAAVGPNFPLLFRLSAEECVPGGLSLDQTRIIARLLEEAGVQALDVSVGNYATPGRLITAPMDIDRGWLAADAARIKEVVSLPVIAVGRLDDPLLAEQVLASGAADLIAIGRGLLTDPQLPSKAQRGDLAAITPCIACNQACIAFLMHDRPISCLLNPSCGRERDFAIVRAPRPKRVLVAGGGPAGLEAARVLAERGHRVQLVEADNRLGGEFALAAIPPKKEEIANALAGMIRQVERQDVEIFMRTMASRELVERLHPDTVLVCTGARPVRLPVPGVETEKVVFARDVLRGDCRVGRRVLVIGAGPVGLETSEFLAVQGSEVTVVEVTGSVGVGLEEGHRHWVLNTLGQYGARLLDRTLVDAIESDGAVRVWRDGKGETLGPFDTIVLAAGYRSNDELYRQIQTIVPEVYLIGDAVRPRSAVEAILEAATRARAI